MSRLIQVNVYKLTAKEMAERLGKSPGVVRQWRALNILPKNPEIRAKYLSLEHILAGPGLLLKREIQAKRRAKKNTHAK